MSKPSIFEAATLIVYKMIPHPYSGECTDTLRWHLEQRTEADPLVRKDFLLTKAETKGSVHIQLPLAVHQANHDAWKDLDYLRIQLCEKENLECRWATSMTKSRSTAVEYRIFVRHPKGKEPVKTSRSVRHDERLSTDNFRLRHSEFRLKIVNAALAKISLPPTERDWANGDTRAHSSGQVGGIATLFSPSDVEKCLEQEQVDLIVMDGELFRVEFKRVPCLITPSTCTTIGLVVSGDRSRTREHVQQVEQHLVDYNEANGTSATISNIRMCPESYNYLLCDPCDVVTAQGLCENPMPNRRYFRQIFFANAAPGNYFREHEMEYAKEAEKRYDERVHKSYKTNPPRSKSLFPLIAKINYERSITTPTELEDMRARRLEYTQQLYKDRQGECRYSALRMLPRFIAWNREIPKLGAKATDMNALLKRDERLIEDMDALETEIEMHEEVAKNASEHTAKGFAKDYQWAQSRLQEIKRIQKRIELEYAISQAGSKLSLLPRTWKKKRVELHTVDGKQIPVDEALVAELEKAKKDLEGLEAELKELIANHPTCEDPDSSFSSASDFITTPTSPTGSVNQATGSKRKEPPLIPEPAVAREIQRLDRLINAKRRTLAISFGHCPPDVSVPPLDKLQREIDELIRQRDKLRSGSE